MADTALVATSDPLLLDAAIRWCAAAGAAPVTVDSADSARREWRHAGAVLIGADVASQLADGAAGAPPSRRDHVLVLAADPDRVWREAVALGAAGVVAPSDDDAALAALVASLDGRVEGCTVSVVGASGGVGASTFAVGLGLAAAGRGLASVVLDADPGGAGVDLVLGSEHADGLRWPDLAAVDGRLSGESLADALPHHRGVATIAWPVSAPTADLPVAAGAVWSAATRAFDLVVADVPRPGGGADPALAREVLAGSVLTLVVVGDDLPGLGAARRALPRIQQRCARVAVVAVARRGGLGAPEVERALGLPVVARVRADRGLRAAIDHGRGPGRSRSLRRAGRDVLDLLGLDGARPGSARS